MSKQSKRHMGQKVYSTEGVDSINVDSTGAVTLGANPVYQARGTGSQYALNTDTQIKFQAANGFSQNSGTSVANQYTAPSAGVYLVIISISLSSATTATAFLEAKVNGGAVGRICQVPSGIALLNGTLPIKVNANDVITITSATNSGATVSDNTADAFVSFIKIA